MDFSQTLTRFLMKRLPAEEQARLTAEVIAWRFADLPPADQQERIEQFGPGLMQMMRDGRVGLLLLITHHLLRLPLVQWVAHWALRAPQVCAQIAAAEEP